MTRIMIGIAAALLLGACQETLSTPQKAADAPAPETELASPAQLPARLVEHSDFASVHVQSRNISVWLPDGYSPSGEKRYPVIYAHDGQNLFEPSRSYGGVEWGLDETAEAMMASGDIRPAIIVGIWNTDERWQEYAPQKVIENLTGDTASQWLGPSLPELKADAYLRFLVEELKPFIDQTYATKPDQEDTLIMGSSMGGLISLYAISEYPEVFSRAAAVSAHWPLTEPEGAMAQQADVAMQTYLASGGIDQTQHQIWFDRGTETLDAAYQPHADAMESWFRSQGWDETQAIFRAYPGTDHSEAAWAARADDILNFLLDQN